MVAAIITSPRRINEMGNLGFGDGGIGAVDNGSDG